MADLVLDWSLFGTYGTTLGASTTVDTGGVAVTVGFTAQDEGASNLTADNATYVAAGEDFDPNSSLKLFGFGGEGGIDQTSTVTMDFASTSEDFQDPVQNVSFRLNDIDGQEDPGNDGGVHWDKVVVTAYDADGNEVPVTFTAGSDLTYGEDRVYSLGSAHTPTDSEASALVEIAGPVARIEIEYLNMGDDDQRIFVSDVHFTTCDFEPPETELDGTVEGTEGADIIDVNYTGDPEGDMVDNGDNIFPGFADNADIIEGYGGDDTIYGGDDGDTIDGGDGSDEIYGGDNGDLIISGPGATDGALPDLGYPGYYPSDPDPTNDQDYVVGGGGADTIMTGDDADTIFGGLSTDLIDGGLDADEISGGSGSDTIIGGEGSDTIMGDSGDDLIYGGLDPSYPDSVNIPDATDLVPDNGKDYIHAGTGNDTVFGADDDDTIYGGVGNDYLDGQIDEDEIYGGSGDDTLIGGAGADLLQGGGGVDLIEGGDDNDTIVGINIGESIHGGSGGLDDDTLIVQGSGEWRLTNLVTDSDGNGQDGTVEFLDTDGNVTGTADFTNIENIIPCFTPGSLIATPQGARPVETLQEGDKIITRDNGIQEIRWLGARQMSGIELAREPKLKPVLIRQGALGNGLPERDMQVSPNHRVLVTNEKVNLYFDETEVLASAKHLVGLPGIHKINVMSTTYIHFMFDQHEVVLSDGAWTESFQPGDYSLKGIGREQREELFHLFPELKEREGVKNYHAARRSLKKHETTLLLE